MVFIYRVENVFNVPLTASSVLQFQLAQIVQQDFIWTQIANVLHAKQLAPTVVALQIVQLVWQDSDYLEVFVQIVKNNLQTVHHAENKKLAPTN